VILKEARINAGFTLKRAVEALNVSEKTLINWESGETRLPASIILRIQEVYRLNDAQVTALLELEAQRKKGGAA